MAAAGWISATVDAVTFVGGLIWSCSKNQYQYKANLEAFNDRKEELRQLHGRIRLRLGRELQAGRIARSDVGTWLAAADLEMSRQSVEDEVSQSGCLSSRIFRTRTLNRRTAKLNRIYGQGERLDQMPSLVDDDYPSIVRDDRKIYEALKGKLLSRCKDVKSRLHTQLQDRWKIETEGVKLWLRNVEELSGQAATSFEEEFNNVTFDGGFSKRVKDRNQQLEELLREGAELPESLVVDDYSQTLGDDEIQSFRGWKDKLQVKHRDVNEKLSTERRQNPEKIVTEQVEQWLQKVEGDQLIPAASDVHNQLSSGHPPYPASLVNRIKDLIQEMEKLCNEGDQLPQSLVVDDYSQTLSDDDRKTFAHCNKKLWGKYQDVGRILHSQLRLGKIEMEQVQIWKEQVEETTDSAADVQNQLNNGPPHTAPLVGRVKELIQEMEKLHDEGCKLPESLVIDDPSASAPPMLTPELRGSDAVKAEILGHLRGDETGKIGVWGMGGVGKTTIMKHVYNQLLNESKFKVIWVTVSQTFNVFQIQKEIATSLGEDLSEHQSTDVRATTLSKMLETRKPCVVILDDVWNSIDLEEVGIPQPRVNDSCKLLLTTRSKEVARGMGCVTIEVKTLSPEASLTLFNDIVGDVALSEDGDIKNTLKLIVGECNGLPLAIKVVAGGMKGIFEPHRWRAALSQLKQGRRKDVYSKLKFSYDWLNDKNIQHCFLHCALYPEDHEILKEELIEYWIDEELIDVMQTRQEMKDEGHAILNKLEENCLLEFTRDWRERDCVRMHDLVRDMAIDITRSSNPRFLVKAGVGLGELPEEREWEENLSKVSLMFNNIEDIPPSMPSPKCPILTTLLLSHNRISTIPENFFEHMPELKVLDLSYSWNLRSLPSSVSNLVRLTTLLLRGCRYLKEVPSLSSLTALKKLDLYGAGLEEVPHGLEMLLNLKYLDIGRGLWPDSSRSISPGWKKIVSEILPNLSKLQHLGLDRRLQVEGGQLSGIWPKLEIFYGGFRTWSDMSIFLSKRQKSLYHYNIYVGDPNNPYNDIYLLKYISIYDINICGEPGSIPSDVQELLISDCNDVRRLNAISGFQDVFDLQRCEIRDCTEVEYVFSGLNKLSKLKELRLWELENLKGLFDSEAAPPLAVFSSLEEISIRRCPRIKKLFPTTLQYLPNLLDISVHDCSELEEIVVASSSEEEGRVVHAKLEKLSLKNLPMFRSISSLTDASVFDSLKELRISGCRNLDMEYVFGGQIKFNSFQTLEILLLDGLQSLKSIFHEEADESLAFSAPLSSTETISFPLKELRVKDCPQLKNFGFQVGSFQNIESIDVKGCDRLEEIMAASSETEEDQSEPFLSKLKYLFLTELPVLRRICSALLVLDSLRELTIEDCPNLSWECLFGLHVELPRTLCSLRLKGVRNLESVFDEEASDSLAFWRLPPAATTSFALGTIYIENCPQLKRIFSHAGQLDYFQNVSTIVVTGCDELEEIISLKSEEEFIKVTRLSKLEWLTLRNLPKLKRVCTGTSALICDSLIELTISGCTDLKRVPLHLLRSDNGQLSPPPRLREIELSDKEKEWWESLEWDQPNAEAVLSPLCKFK